MKTLIAGVLMFMMTTGFAQNEGNPPATDSLSTENDGVLMSGGKMYFVKHGQPKQFRNTLRLSEGIIAEPNGRITLPDKRMIILADGQMVTLEGEIKSAPPNLKLEDGPPVQTQSNRGLYPTTPMAPVGR